MDLAFQLNDGVLAPLLHRHWLKAEEYAQLLRAQEALSVAQQEAQCLRREAASEAEALRHRAHEQGLAEGRAEAAEQLAAIALRSAEVLRRLAALRARSVMRARLAVVQDLRALGLAAAARPQAARVVRSEAFLVLRVPPEHESAAREALAALLSEGGLPGAVELVADPALADHACVMESESGVVSAGLDVQLAAIGRAVSAAVARLATEVEPLDGAP